MMNGLQQSAGGIKYPPGNIFYGTGDLRYFMKNVTKGEEGIIYSAGRIKQSVQQIL